MCDKRPALFGKLSFVPAVLTKKGQVPIIKFPRVKYGARSSVMASNLPPEG